MSRNGSYTACNGLLYFFFLLLLRRSFSSHWIPIKRQVRDLSPCYICSSSFTFVPVLDSFLSCLVWMWFAPRYVIESDVDACYNGGGDEENNGKSFQLTDQLLSSSRVSLLPVDSYVRCQRHYIPCYSHSSCQPTVSKVSW